MAPPLTTILAISTIIEACMFCCSRNCIRLTLSARRTYACWSTRIRFIVLTLAHRQPNTNDVHVIGAINCVGVKVFDIECGSISDVFAPAGEFDITEFA